LKEGDGNTKYFQFKASGRKKKNHISAKKIEIKYWERG
jgi:hypothetical protein